MKPILAIIALSLLAAPAAQPTDEQQQTQQQDAPAPDNGTTQTR